MSKTEPQHQNGNVLVEALLGLWEEAQNILLNMTVEERVTRFLEIRQHGNFEQAMDQILHEFCRFWEESLRQFGNLTDEDRETWLQEARSRGLVEVRFANALQEIHQREIHPPHRPKGSITPAQMISPADPGIV